MDPAGLSFERFHPLRVSEEVRKREAETHLEASDFIYPLFVVNGRGISRPIEPMPGIRQLSADLAVDEVKRAVDAGVSQVLLFGLPDDKDETGSRAWDPAEVVQQATEAIKRQVPDATVITDVCLCEYTSHGHCGVLTADGAVDNDATLALLARTAVSHAEAGADIVAPSSMMDGQVAALKSGLAGAGFRDTKVMGYSAKYASAFYGPFRVAADSAPQFGDRRAYQMAPTQRDEAIREIAADVAEGADFIMVKPALAYLDVVRDAARTYDLPLAAYNVSGEYSMVAAAGAKGWIDRKRAALEILTAIKRAGADLTITYHAVEAAGWLDNDR